MTFDDLGLRPETLHALADLGYQTPTPIQEKAIPMVLMGRDVLGVAQTGTGKTAGFTLPMIDILAEGRGRARMPRSLILEPTRELAAQVAESFDRYGKYHRLTKALLIGGESVKDQQTVLQRGVDVLIATPGRLLDLFERGQILLADTKLLVIDEADRMLDMGFMPDVERIVNLLPPLRQTLFFSATMAPEIRKLGNKFLHNPKEISVAPPASPAATVAQRVLHCHSDPKAKRAALRSLLDAEKDEIQSALIFCNRKRDVDLVYKSLKRHGYDAEALHGDMAQPARVETLKRFKNDEIRLLVCSDVAARGLDIPRVSHVFNFDVPINSEDYVHRIGRTGRAGRSGKAFMLATRNDEKLLANLHKLIGAKIEEIASPTGETVETPALLETSEAKPRRSRGKRRSGRDEPREAREPRQPAAEPIEAEAIEAETVETGAAPQPERAVAKPAAEGGRRRKARAEPARRRRDESHDDEASPVGDTPFGDHVPAFILREVPAAVLEG
ncbi:Superfamily II DNA and RNA helicase [Tistlia consotensis]|uniref:DEAD-box ATP-dependent RNA helicase RhpA n=1 Tax=Tistlia consotensis USBA 355 TaxID=560819 RepID=A0A1Y6BW17_9PROT|nr:DEAD/DEAH box helicase [Tistlia consotensis]SMF24120.1 Superfamily II DNA and RNA helicase [Tistlia consotensis USBA 355]SNR60897.1 Superfamily II DNA and RNA helicase [Tistlia consotensis]